MSFDEVQFPSVISYGSSGGPMYSTAVETVSSGSERRNQNWSQARHRYDVTPVMNTQSAIAAVLAFFHARAGRARGFRYKDWADFTSASDGISTASPSDQIIGTGDGSNRVFQLAKLYTSGGVTRTRTITKPVAGTVRVAVNGVEKTLTTHFTVDTTTGVVTFTVGNAPSNGHIVTAGFQFDVPVRFDTDTLDTNLVSYQRGAAQVTLVELRV